MTYLVCFIAEENIWSAVFFSRSAISSSTYRCNFGWCRLIRYWASGSFHNNSGLFTRAIAPYLLTIQCVCLMIFSSVHKISLWIWRILDSWSFTDLDLLCKSQTWYYHGLFFHEANQLSFRAQQYACLKIWIFILVHFLGSIESLILCW